MEISDKSEVKIKAEPKFNVEEDILSRTEVSVISMFVTSLCV